MSLMERIEALAKECDTEEQELIEDMILCAADYVRSVIVMETNAKNLRGKEAAEYREIVTATDRSRTMVHNALIAAVNIVKRICQIHDHLPIYIGDEQRRLYGDFAMELTTEIFKDRK